MLNTLKNKYLMIFLILSFFVFILYFGFLRKDGEKVSVYKNNELLFTEALNSGKKQIQIENTNVILELDGEGNIFFVSSDCPDKLCIKKGKLHKNGDFAACIPNGILLQIK